MSIRSSSLTILVALFVGALSTPANAAGPNTVHYTVDAAMISTGVDADAVGRVQALVKQQGRSDRQRLRVTANHLDPRTTYTLLAQVGASPDWVTVTNFTTSSAGRASVIYVQSAAGSASRRALPQLLNSVTDVRSVAIATPDGYIVLSANLHEAETMRFELTSVFDNTGSDPFAVGVVAMACQKGLVQFRLFAAAQSSQLVFCVNDNPVATYAADGAGRFSAGVLPNSAPSPLLFKTMSLRNAGEDVVLQSDVR
ncbi:MAG TPA: hypothetical protein VNT99_14875 [Methylomirabilota bacterium]|nr:hypothetical protein [Methylomirabilota bacterium]